MAENSHHQLVLVQRDGRLMRLRDVVLDAPEDEGLERRVTGVVGLDKQPQHLPLLAINTSLATSISVTWWALVFATVLDRQNQSKAHGDRGTCSPTMPPSAASARAIMTSRTRSCT